MPITRRELLVRGTAGAIGLALGGPLAVDALVHGQARAADSGASVSSSVAPSIAASQSAELWKPTNFLAKPDAKEALQLPWANGRPHEFSRITLAGAIPGVVEAGVQGFAVQDVDLGTLGPDVDTIAGIDFPGLIRSGAGVVHFPENGQPTETRVVFIKRTDVETAQLREILGGDAFELYQVSKFGTDHNLDVMARVHAFNTAREHQVVYYLGDLGQWLKQWGAGEPELVQRMFRAMRPSIAGIPEPDFVNDRIYVPGQ
jgi:hypothetical protein